MCSIVMAVVLSAGCLNHGASAAFVADVETTHVGTALECHTTRNADSSLDWADASKRFRLVVATFGRAAKTTRENVASTVQGRSRHVASGLRAVKRAATSTLVQTHLSLLVAARPVASHVMQRLFAQPSATSGVLWDDRRLLDEVSSIA